ncbi:MAG: DUF4751 family protein [Candidatus Sulfotelmatobacter sp.]
MGMKTAYRLPLAVLLLGLVCWPHWMFSAEDLVDWSHSWISKNIDYQTWDGSHWSAVLDGKTFLHAPKGDFRHAHRDTIINYKAWDGRNWTAKINDAGNGFVHALGGDWAQSHPDVVIGYLHWSGGWYLAKLEGTGFRHAGPVTLVHKEIDCGLFGPHHAAADCPSLTSHAECSCSVQSVWGKAECGCVPGAAGKPPNPPAELSVSTCQVDPQSITLGGSANLIVNLSRPAPAGGVSVTIDTTSDGSADTLEATPVSLSFAAGVPTFKYPLRTRVVQNPAKKIIFSAHIGGGGVVRSAELDIP